MKLLYDTLCFIKKSFIVCTGLKIDFYFTLEHQKLKGSAMAWWLMPRTPDPEVGVRAPHGSNRVVSLSKAHLLPESTGNTKEVVAPSQHD